MCTKEVKISMPSRMTAGARAYCEHHLPRAVAGSFVSVRSLFDVYPYDSHYSLAAARAAATASIKRLEKAGVKFRRPEDYYAEMCKTDKHMAKVKDKLIHDKKNIEQAENRRKLREQKKFGKQIQHAKEAEKREKKKENQEAVKKWRTDKKSLDSGDFSLPNEDLSKGSEARDRKRKAAEEASEDRKKAKWTKESKDAKYRFGKKTMKRNRDGSGLDDFVGVSGRGGSGKGGGKGKGGSGKGKGGKGGAKRPGKSARDKGRR